MKKKVKIKIHSLVLAAFYFLFIFAPHMHVAGIVCPHGSGDPALLTESAIYPDECSDSLKESHFSGQVDSLCPICQLLTSCFCLRQVEADSSVDCFASAKLIINEDSKLCKKANPSNPPTGPPAA